MEDYRKHLYDALHAASRDYDQAILTLAAATLALSVTFVKDIAPHPVGDTRLLLLGAWGGLVVSIVAMLASFLTSQHVIRDRLAATFEPDATPAPPRDNYELATEIFNGVAGAGFVLGLALLGWYALANM